MIMVDVEESVPIDPFAPLVDGRYQDRLITIERLPGARPELVDGMIRTERFDVLINPSRLFVWHSFGPQEISNDLAVILAKELFETGWLRGAKLFERIFTGIVRTCAADPLAAWQCFYRNTLAGSRARDLPAQQLRTPQLSDHDDLPNAAPDTSLDPVHAHLLPMLHGGTVLDLGSCFGFLALRIAERGVCVTAADSDASMMNLLRSVSEHLDADLHVRVEDARYLSFPDDSFDTVLAIHLLEHLEPAQADQVLDQLVRVGRRQAIVAVPFEAEPNESYGHVRTLDLAELHRCGRRSGHPYRAYEHHGGWLIVDLAG